MPVGGESKKNWTVAEEKHKLKILICRGHKSFEGRASGR